ncbi:MAG: DUF3943 domain-containing protein, partial [Clostridiales bacterium]|nr:DUF3943 domain-containing protein [Clostridiales bacterium]
WEEDVDSFKVNQLGLSYQGAFYFNTGRVNGFGYYGSAFFNILGSVSWEIIGENEPAAMNDLITTVIGSMSVGEMFYRLYLEAYAAGVPGFLTFFINPVASLHRLTGWKVPESGRNIYELKYYTGGGFAYSDSSVPGEPQNNFSHRGPYVSAGTHIIYGNPFEQDSIIPYRHFELDTEVGLDMGNYMEFRIVSDGYLLSFSPVWTDKDSMSTGLSVHFDCILLGQFGLDSSINQFSNAIDWTVKHQHLFSEDTTFQIKLHAGLTFLGSSNYYLNSWEAKGPYEPKNFGCGFNSKLFLNFENKKFGRLEADILFYTMWTFPGSARFSHGYVYWIFADLSYSHHITEKISLGITNSFAIERGTFSGYSDTNILNNAVKVFVAWNL